LSIPKFNNFHPFYAFYLPLNTPKSVLIFFKHTYFITRHWSRWGCFQGLPWFAKIPNKIPRQAPWRPFFDAVQLAARHPFRGAGFAGLRKASL
jgi:hypothetical protein